MNLLPSKKFNKPDRSFRDCDLYPFCLNIANRIFTRSMLSAGCDTRKTLCVSIYAAINASDGLPKACERMVLTNRTSLASPTKGLMVNPNLAVSRLTASLE